MYLLKWILIFLTINNTYQISLANNIIDFSINLSLNGFITINLPKDPSFYSQILMDLSDFNLFQISIKL